MQVERIASTPQWPIWWKAQCHSHRSRSHRLFRLLQHRLLQLLAALAVRPVRFQLPLLASRCWREASLCRKESSVCYKKLGVATAINTVYNSWESTADRLLHGTDVFFFWFLLFSARAKMLKQNPIFILFIFYYDY